MKNCINKIHSLWVFVFFIISSAQSMEQQAPEISTGMFNNLCAWVQDSRPMNLVVNHPVATMVTALTAVTSTAYFISSVFQAGGASHNERNTSLVQYPSELSAINDFNMLSNTLQNLSAFFVQYPSGLSRMNGLNQVIELSLGSEMGRMVQSYFWEQGYQGNFSNFHLVRFERLATEASSNYSFGNYVVAECSKVCIDTITEISGFWCHQLSDHVFVSHLSKILGIDQQQYIIPSGVYTTPHIEDEYPIASYPEIIGRCKSFVK